VIKFTVLNNIVTLQLIYSNRAGGTAPVGQGIAGPIIRKQKNANTQIILNEDM